MAESTTQGSRPTHGTISVDTISGAISLPTGAATETTLAALNTKVTAVNTGAVTVSAALPAGSATIGAVNLAQYTPLTGRLPTDGSGVTQPVSGTFWQATQPVSGTVTANAGTGTLAVNANITNASIAVTGTFWQATQPVSGTVTANAGTGTLAVSGPLTDTQLRVTAVPVSGTVTANAGTGTLAVSGPLTDTQLRATAVPVSGTVTANAGTGTLAVSGPLTDTQLRATAVPVSGTFWQSTQPVSGTVTANKGGTWALDAGSANIGDVDVLTIAAGTNRIGGTYEVGGTIIDEVPSARTVSRAFANATASGNTAVVAAQGAGVRIRVLAVFTVTGTALTVKFQSATTDITAGFVLAVNGGMVLPNNPHGWFQTNANEALNINLSGAGTVGVNVVWVQAT